MMLLLRLPKQLRRRRRIQDWLLLVLRILCIMLFVMAALQPVLRWPESNTDLEQAKRMVFILDDSLSMDHVVEAKGLNLDDQTAFTTARSAMVEQVKSLPEGVEIGLVLTAGEAKTLTPELKSDRAEIMTLITERSQQFGDTDLAGALKQARRLLDGRGGSIHVYSDEAGLGTVSACEEELSLLASQKAALVPHLTRAERPQNVAVVSAVYGEGVEGGSVRFELRNYGESEREVTTTAILPDGTEINTFVTVPAGGLTEEMVTVPRITEGGIGSIRVDDDGLKSDNLFYFQLPQIGAARVLLIDGEPGATTSDSEIYYLERAIAPWGSNRGGALPDVVGETGIALLNRETHRVVFMANIGNPASLAPTLTAFVRDGGGLFVSLGDNVTVERYNSALSDILPTQLRALEQVSHAQEKGKGTRIPDVEHPIFSPYKRGGLSGFSQLRFKSIFSVEPFDTNDRSKVLLELDNGMPLLIEHKVGQGMVYLLTSTIDDEWGNLPLQATFLPLIQRSIAQLGGASGSGGQRIKGLVDEPIRLDFGGSVVDLVVDGPAGPVFTQKQGNSIVFTPAVPGAHIVHAKGGPPLAQAAVNINPDESVIERPQGLLETAAAIEPEAFTKRVPLFPYFLWLALALFALQAWLAWHNQEDSDVVHA